ncbi:MAG: uracil-DNA glycosylase family protein [Flavobacteriaceae bacterium]|nr:uracil-DNA glycosylase family protein [Flavobacteriaceae bacterium]
MFLHIHPYPPYIPSTATKLIVGTLPPPRFTTGELKEGDVNFCYGSRDGQLWPILNEIFQLHLKFETTEEAILQRKEFLHKRGIGICDIVQSAKREKVDASDIGMQDIELRDLIQILNDFPKIDTLLFTGGNSKNGPEYFFRKLIKNYPVNLEVVSEEVPRIHQFVHPVTNKLIKTISLIAPSGAANRAVGSLQEYKDLKKKNPEMTTVDFRVLQYKIFF